MRVIQRNLVYVVGLTMNNCREEVSIPPLLSPFISKSVVQTSSPAYRSMSREG